MRILVSLVSATALLASGISAVNPPRPSSPPVPATPPRPSPAGGNRAPSPPPVPVTPDRSGAGGGSGLSTPGAPAKNPPNPPYDLSNVIKTWFREERVHLEKMFPIAAATKGGWESWAQLELEQVFKATYKDLQDIREVGQVYDGNERADFVLPEVGPEKKGMIIEVKVELRKGSEVLTSRVGQDKKKKGALKQEYSDWPFVALALAFSPETQKKLEGMGMTMLQDEFPFSGGSMKMKAYISNDSKKMPDLYKLLEGDTGPSRSSSPTVHSGSSSGPSSGDNSPTRQGSKQGSGSNSGPAAGQNPPTDKKGKQPATGTNSGSQSSPLPIRPSRGGRRPPQARRSLPIPRL